MRAPCAVRLHSSGQYVCMVCMVTAYSKGKDQPGKVANPARGQLNRENAFFPVLVCVQYPLRVRARWVIQIVLR